MCCLEPLVIVWSALEVSPVLWVWTMVGGTETLLEVL